MAFWPWSSESSKHSSTSTTENNNSKPSHSQGGQSEIEERSWDSRGKSHTDLWSDNTKAAPSASSRIQELDKSENIENDTALQELRSVLFLDDMINAPEKRHSPTEDPSALYSSTLSCMQCFDLAFYCSSLGGQFNNIYRYGGLRSCSDLWAQWRFCMRTKTMTEEERKRRIVQWNREKEAKKRIGRSSEEIWKIRNLGAGEGVTDAFAVGKEMERERKSLVG